MPVRIHESIDQIPAADWNRVAATDNPFLQHAFLAALEHHGCVGPQFGWLPQHVAVYDLQGALIGAAPLYLKDNSYGEFVFDWSWADAYERAGGAYYPKLVSAVPYTPATGPRLLAADVTVQRSLLEAALVHARELNVSSLHWLFPPTAEVELMEEHGLMRRTGCQFHWHNRGYRDFADFLDRFSAQKRKKLKRERRRVAEAGLQIERIHGHEASDEQLAVAAEFYRSTFDKKWGVATLNLGFFREVARTMGERLVLIMASDPSRYVAAAICFRGDDALYGRHWGCNAEFHSLHFELCYYQGIDYCIDHGLKLFEPGAQGEHKVSRGFEPTPTWSGHWIADPRFAAAIGDFLRREQGGMQHYMDELAEHLPYRCTNQ